MGVGEVGCLLDHLLIARLCLGRFALFQEGGSQVVAPIDELRLAMQCLLVADDGLSELTRILRVLPRLLWAMANSGLSPRSLPITGFRLLTSALREQDTAEVVVCLCEIRPAPSKFPGDTLPHRPDSLAVPVRRPADCTRGLGVGFG